MKNFILIQTILALALIPSILSGFSGNGSGMKAAPYQITNLQQLQEMNDDLSAHYILMNDIDASDTENWNSGKGFVPIGTYTFKTLTDGFTGLLNGQGYTISGLYIDRPDEDYIGLFGCITDGGYIFDVNIEDAEVTGKTRVSVFAGSIYAYDEGSEVLVLGCSSNGSSSGKYRVGGFCGINSVDKGTANISDCYAKCKVSGFAGEIGGFCGMNNANNGIVNISGCYSTGDVSGDMNVGGFCGSNFVSNGTANISDCYASCNASGNKLVGGFCGSNYTENGTAILERCFSIGVTTGDFSVGGFCGSNYAENGTANISDCYAMGNVSGNDYVGGFCGYNYTHKDTVTAIIERCYSIGATTGSYNIGGFCGDKEGVGTSEINYCFWDIEASLYTNSDGGIGKTTNQMKTQSTFETWDFNNVWCMAEGKTYPQLQYFVDCDTLTSVTEERYDNEIEIYPNPASDYIEISIDGAHLEGGLHLNIEIYNVLCTKVMTVETRHALSLQRIDISQLPRGVYFVRIGNQVEKFVVLK